MSRRSTALATATTPEVDSLCSALERGESLAEWCRADPSRPSRETVYNTMERDEALAQRVAQAREAGYDAIARQALTLIDTQPADQVEAAWRRAQADVRLRLLACWSPQRYGRGAASDGATTVQVLVQTQVPRG